MGKGLILLTKDVLRSDYLSCYNENAAIPTPNIDKLAEEGTIFTNYYASAPSTAMAVTCMFSGLNAFELERKSYRPVEQFSQVPTIFNEMEKSGIPTFVLWSEEFENLAYVYSKVFDDSTTIHYAPPGGAVWATPSNSRLSSPVDNYDLSEYFIEYVNSIQEKCEGEWFLWCHCPHIFYPCSSYGSDIGIFDNLVGRLSEEVDADIILSGDHGHMGGQKGKIVYGFHVYESAISIPLITPNWLNKKSVDFPTSQNQLKSFILSKELEMSEFIYTDTKYYEQPGRVLMIRRGRFKYIYNKKDKSEELYDLSFDNLERVNLLIDLWPDYDRNGSYYLDQIIHYPHWQEAEENYKLLVKEKNRIWKEGSPFMRIVHTINDVKNAGISSIFRRKPRINAVNGRWNSRARINT